MCRLRQSSTPIVSEIIHETQDPQVPQASSNVIALDVIHEAASSPDDTHLSQIDDEHNSSKFYIEEADNSDSNL